jgi:hypothetical protein
VNKFNYRFSASYITGSHAFKTGYYLQRYDLGREGAYNDPNQIHGARDYTFRNQVPVSVRIWAVPYEVVENSTAVGIFAQDQWTVKKLTLNLGVRYDSFNASVPAHHLPAGPFVPARDFPAVSNVPDWRNVNPRLGVAYDVFGNGKTAVKVSLGKYVQADGMPRRNTFNPVLQNNTTTRTWNNANKDFVVHGDPLNPMANGELGPSTNLSFGQSILNTRPDPAWYKGFDVRPYNWEFSTSVQRELAANVGMNVAYFRRWFGNFEVTHNLATAASDYDTFCITAPVDARLPGSGGQQICGLFDLKPSKVGQIDTIVTSGNNYGKSTEAWNGLDVSLNARLGKGVLMQGGVSTGKTVTDKCEVAKAVPESNISGSTVTPLVYCHNETPFLTQVKGLATYTLPWHQINLAATLQNRPGPSINANYVASNAQVAPSLGRNLSSGSNVTVSVVPPNTLYTDRMNQLDFRVGKTFMVGRVRVQGSVDFFNALNGNAILLENSSYGSTGATWRVPQAVLPARLTKLEVKVDF